MNRNMEAITWALHARGVSPTAFRLLIQLCSHVNSAREDFDVWPKHRTLASAVEISISGVKRHLGELVEKGFVEVRASTRENGGKSVNIYRILVDSTHRMPGGITVDVGSFQIAQSDLSDGPIGQVDLCPQVTADLCPQVTADLCPQVTADLCNEPLKERTSEIMNVPPTEEAPAGFQQEMFEGAVPPVVVAGADAPKASGEGVSDDDRPVTVADVVEAWGELSAECGLAGLAKLTDGRRKKIAAQIRRFTLEEWRIVIANIKASSFLRGENDRGWRVSFDYLLSEENFVKILDGKFSNAPKRMFSWQERPSSSELGVELARELAAENFGPDAVRNAGASRRRAIIDHRDGFERELDRRIFGDTPGGGEIIEGLGAMIGSRAQ